MVINTPTGKEGIAEQNAGSQKGAISIASVTVAYNGANVLSRHLDAVKRQTRRIDEIVVVNNASTDDTLTLLAARYPEITVLNLSENGGVGGGLAAGLNYAAITKKYDWVWLFDQDSVPLVNGLEVLLAGLRHLDESEESTAILAPVNIHPETKMTCPGFSWRGGRLRTTPELNQHITFVDSVISSGTLIRREAVEAVGLPRADFFMDFVDHEHCLRLRRHGFRIAVVRDSLLHHVHGDPSKFKILGRTKYWTDHVPWREYYMTRNEIFTIWQNYPKWSTKGFTLYRLARHALDLLLFGKRKLACFGMMYRGFLDGRAGRLGIRFLATSR
ncbi:MAG: glycosyltransferase [Candidatus Sulfotelmatobacter sp.]|jgi:rhamnosyltransferase